MLEEVSGPSRVLCQDNEFPAKFLAATLRPDGAVLLARVPSSGRELDVFRILPKSMETLELAKRIAIGGTVATAIAWLPITSDLHLICVGFSNGGLSLITPRGAVCLSVGFVPRPIQKLRLGRLPRGDASMAKVSGETDMHLLVLQEGGALVVVELESLRCGMLGAGSVSSSRPEAVGEGLRFQLYELRGREATVDICMIDQILAGDDVFCTQAAPAIIALGTKPFLSQHRLSNDRVGRRSLIGSAASALGSYARSWIPFGGRNASDGSLLSQQAAGLLRISDIQVTARGKVEELAVAAKFIDHARVGDHLVPAPASRQAFGVMLGVTCDGFGRVGLFCLETLRCLHLWKGYRDAQVAWLQQPLSSSAEAATASSTTIATMFPSLLLVIYAPRRGLLELWDVFASPAPVRTAAAAVGSDCQLLSACDQTNAHAHLLKPDGQLQRILWTIASAEAPSIPTAPGLIGRKEREGTSHSTVLGGHWRLETTVVVAEDEEELASDAFGSAESDEEKGQSVGSDSKPCGVDHVVGSPREREV